MTQATARHILVSSEQTCLDLKNDIENGTISFEDAAKQHSSCPSGQSGGDLGSFGSGMMVPEFDKVCFNEAIGVIHGPVQTQFGFHLVEVTDRSE